MNAMYKAEIFAIGISLAMLLPAAGVNAAEAKSVINGDWEITWGDGTATTRNLKTGEEKVLFESVRPKSEEDSRSTYEMLSVVGTLFSVSGSWYSEGGAHPSYGTAWTATNLDPDGSANLVDLFGKEAVFNRLMRDVTIQSAPNGVYTDTESQPHPTPKNLHELLEYVDGGCHAWMGPHMLEQYYFTHRLGGKVAVVEIGLSHGCEVNRGMFTELARLYFPIPDALRADFDKAVRDGVLEDKPFQKPSYNCSKAETGIEFAICTDAELAKLDVDMAKRYKAARRAAAGDARKRVKQDQRNWIEIRNRECAEPTDEPLDNNGKSETFARTVVCLVKSYETRLAALK